MKISVLTLFPEMIEPFISQSIIKRAIDDKKVDVEFINIRDFTKDLHRTVDSRPYGGGAGMILIAEPIVAAIRNAESKIQNSKSPACQSLALANRQINPKPKTKKIKQKIVLTSPRGRVYDQSVAREYSTLDHLILIAGHYEGIDERVVSYIDEEVSMGDFILTGGELVCTCILDSVIRLLPGVLKKDRASTEESFWLVDLDELIDVVGENVILAELKKRNVHKVRLLEYPHYTRPEMYKKARVPEILLSGNHEEIRKWRIKKAFDITVKRRKNLLAK